MTRLRPGRHRRARAATLLFFCLVGLPVIWFAGALSVDFVRVLSAQRSASQIADAGSVAGAGQYLPNDPNNPYQVSFQLDSGGATQVANSMIAEAMNSGMGRFIRLTGQSVTVTQAAGSTPATVTVTLDYEVKNLIFLQLADHLNPQSRLAHGRLTRSAFVCQPGQQTYTYGGSCVRASG